MKRNDYTIRANRQAERKTDVPLWDVVVGKNIKVTTCKGKEVAQAMADRLNIDPDYLERGQTLADRQLQAPYIVART
jgi:hypothetical protein